MRTKNYQDFFREPFMHQITIFYCNGDNDLHPSSPSPAYYCYRGLTRTNHRCPSLLIHPSTLPDAEIFNSYGDKCDHQVCQDIHPSRQWPNNEYQLLPELMLRIVHLIYVDKPLYPYFDIILTGLLIHCCNNINSGIHGYQDNVFRD